MTLEVLWKYAKWAALGLLVLLGWIVWVWLRPKQPVLKDGEPAIPPAPAPLVEAFEKAHEEALVARAKASAATEARQEQLQEISKIDDGKERRKRLAAMLKKQ